MKEIITGILKGIIGRRGFLRLLGKTALSVTAVSLFTSKKPKAFASVSSGSETLLKNGTIVDGTGKRGF